MYKLLLTILVATALLVSETVRPHQAIAKTCASNCGAAPVQFIPGQPINVEVVNFTRNLVQMQNVPTGNSIPITPGELLRLVRGGATEPNLSLVFWDVKGLALQIKILKPENKTLRIEIRPGGRQPRDRTVYLKDDGRIAVF